jgi:hypothetical protein
VAAGAAELAPELAFAVAGCVEAAGPVDAADEGAEVAGLVPAPVLAVVSCAGAADPVVPVAAEVADAAVEVTEETAEVADAVTAEVAGTTADVGESAACACRDNPSSTATTPTVKIATWAARRAMCRNNGWDTKAPAQSGEAARPDFPR